MKNSNPKKPICNLHISKNIQEYKHNNKEVLSLRKLTKLLMYDEDHNSIFKLCVDDSTLESYALATQVYGP